jgi:hypothetical protein
MLEKAGHFTRGDEAQRPSPDDRNSRYCVWDFQRDIHPHRGAGEKPALLPALLPSASESHPKNF